MGISAAIVGNLARGVGARVRDVPEASGSGGRDVPDLAADEGPERLSPAAMSPADAAKVLTRLGGQPIDEASLQADIDAGAPTNPDGTLNLVHYAAWLVRQMAAVGGGGRGD